MKDGSFDVIYPVVITVDVAWGEMDSFAHVNNIVFFRYFESVRMTFLTQVGFADPADNNGIGPILASTHCTFRRPLRYPDTVRVGTRVAEISEERFEMEYAVFSNTRGEVVATGGGVVVAFNYVDNRKASIPEQVRRKIVAYEK